MCNCKRKASVRSEIKTNAEPLKVYTTASSDTYTAKEVNGVIIVSKR